MVSILLGLQFPLFVGLAKIGERRPLRKGERQSGYRSVSFSAYSQFTDSVLLHRPEILRRRNITVLRNSFARYYRQHLRIQFINRLYRRVRQGELPEGQEKVPWGTTRRTV